MLTIANSKPLSNRRFSSTAPTRNWRFSASYDSFVVNQTFVLRMNICGKNRQLLVAAKRYAQYLFDCLEKLLTLQS
jgi:hypothetical protein